MNIKIFENEDHLVIDISKAGLKTELTENTVLASLLKSLMIGTEPVTIPGLEAVPTKTEEISINEELTQITLSNGDNVPLDDAFRFNGDLLKDVPENNISDAMLAFWSYSQEHDIKESEADLFKDYVCANFCFIDENTEDIELLKHMLVSTNREVPADEDTIRKSARCLIDDMLLFAIEA